MRTADRITFKVVDSAFFVLLGNPAADEAG